MENDDYILPYHNFIEYEKWENMFRQSKNPKFSDFWNFGNNNDVEKSIRNC